MSGCWFSPAGSCLSSVTGMEQAAADKPKGCNVESSPGYPDSMPACGATQWVKLSESWPKFKIFDFHKILKILLQGQKKVPRERKYSFYDSWGGFVFGIGKQAERFSASLILGDRNTG